MTWTRLGTAVLLICWLLATRGTLAKEVPEIGTEKGQMYPDFLLPRLDGEKVRLSAYRGKKVLLFHFASW